MTIEDRDVYSQYAALIFNIPYEAVTSVQRLQAKEQYYRKAYSYWNSRDFEMPNEGDKND